MLKLERTWNSRCLLDVLTPFEIVLHTTNSSVSFTDDSLDNSMTGLFQCKTSSGGMVDIGINADTITVNGQVKATAKVVISVSADGVMTLVATGTGSSIDGKTLEVIQVS
jgi:hypothetical protein